MESQLKDLLNAQRVNILLYDSKRDELYRRVVENNEEKINIESNNNNENGNYKDIKVAVIAFGVSICVLTIVSTIVIIYFITFVSINHLN